MKKLLKIIPALVFAACCFMFAAKCLKAGGFTGAIAYLQADLCDDAKAHGWNFVKYYRH